MKSGASKRIKVTIGPGDWRLVKAMLKRRFPYSPASVAAKFILLEAAGLIDEKGARVTRSHPESPGVTRGDMSNTLDQDEGKGGPRALTPRVRNKNKNKKEEYVRNSHTGILTRVVGRINELRPKQVNGKRVAGFKPATYEPQIKGILKRGFTEMDIVTVVEWKAEECRRSGDWSWFKPSTLLRVARFAEKLDEALAGVEVGQTGLFDQQENQRHQQDYSKRTGKGDPNDF